MYCLCSISLAWSCSWRAQPTSPAWAHRHSRAVSSKGWHHYPSTGLAVTLAGAPLGIQFPDGADVLRARSLKDIPGSREITRMVRMHGDPNVSGFNPAFITLGVRLGNPQADQSTGYPPPSRRWPRHSRRSESEWDRRRGTVRLRESPERQSQRLTPGLLPP